MSEYRKCWFGFFQKSPASFVRLRQRVVPPRGGGVRHCCRCSLLIIGSICPLSQLWLSRGLLQPIKCALSAPSTPAARIIRPNYSSYPRALFTGMGWLIGGAWVASARILRQSNSPPMSPPLSIIQRYFEFWWRAEQYVQIHKYNMFWIWSLNLKASFLHYCWSWTYPSYDTRQFWSLSGFWWCNTH